MKEQYLKLHEHITSLSIRPDVVNGIINELVDKFNYLNEAELIDKFKECFQGTFVDEHHYLERLLDDLDLPDYIRESVDLDVLAIMMKEGVRHKDTMVAFIPDNSESFVYVLDYEL